MQDTILVIPQYPYCIEEIPQDVPLEDCWYARPQLFFTCYLRPKNGRLPKNPRYKHGPDDVFHHLVFFSTFEELKLPISGPMERAGVTKLYEPSPTPCLYVAPATNMVGRIPLMPLFLAGTSTQPFLTSTASTRALASQWAAVTLLRQMDAVAAMCMRSTRGCGSLDVGSRAWVVCQWTRLLTGRLLLCRRGASAELRLAGVARLVGPDLK